MKLKSFNSISKVNETRFSIQHKLCECKCRLNKSLYNWKQEWKHDKCQCECKYSIDWSSCKKYYMWNPSIYNCKCNKTCEIDEIEVLEILHVERML